MSFPLKARANTIIYQSIPDLTAIPVSNAACSSCDGIWEAIDFFTLGDTYSIDHINFVTGPAAFGTDNNFAGLMGETVRIWNSDYSSVLFSQVVTPTLLSYELHGYSSANQYSTAILSVTLGGLISVTGIYGISFQAYNLGNALFAGGNGSTIQVENPACVPSCGSIWESGANTGYQLISETAAVPLPAALPLFAGGLGLMGWMARRRRGQPLYV